MKQIMSFFRTETETETHETERVMQNTGLWIEQAVDSGSSLLCFQ